MNLKVVLGANRMFGVLLDLNQDLFYQIIYILLRQLYMKSNRFEHYIKSIKFKSFLLILKMI